MIVKHPLRFAPIHKPKPWGEEIWTLADLDGAVLCGGIGVTQSVIDAGPYAGCSLRALLPEICGPHSLAIDGGFPLLCKILEARSDLSLQVHPTSAYAALHPEARPKSEAWYVLDADEGAGIYLGLKPGLTPERLKDAVLLGHAADHVVYRPVHRGELYYLPAGTCHALGAGVRVAEVQSPSDTTFRLYDWHRLPKRELHLSEALACADFLPWDQSRFLWSAIEGDPMGQKQGLMRGPEFSMALCVCSQSLAFDEDLQVWMLLEGELLVEGVTVSAGETVLLPYGYAGVAEGQAVLIEIRLP